MSLFDSIPEHTLLTMVVYGEARGEPLLGKVAVAWVVKNRVLRPGWWGKTWRDVMLKPRQFSCLNESDPNFDAILIAYQRRNMAWLECEWAARGVIDNYLSDPVSGATHYHSTRIHPPWADELTEVAIIGNHRFLK